MALITCSECSAQVSDKASACVQCGNPLSMERAEVQGASEASKVQDPSQIRSSQNATPAAQQKRSKATGWKIVGAAVAVVTVVAIFSPKDNSDPTGQSHELQPATNAGSDGTPGAEATSTPVPAEDSDKNGCTKDDLQCLGDKGIVGAGIYCKDPVERLATHAVQWTDGTFETKFSQFRWLDKANGTITYIGDKAQFQNGFGAYTNVTYECDMAADGKTVLDARVSEGRLPASN